ncbi:hypothetical protein NDU88_006115 [Pleurodeles waltl]|uniref:Uncharacterized protein n=1 Tax=Pleurodeles waltl TaxID=8319 RepID=A0AAV7N1D7_PLEWA|nr:hypothetical protein NDU88_006115 [Pleurodeles waltl]
MFEAHPIRLEEDDVTCRVHAERLGTARYCGSYCVLSARLGGGCMGPQDAFMQAGVMVTSIGCDGVEWITNDCHDHALQPADLTIVLEDDCWKYGCFKAKLRSLQLQYMLLFQAKLKVLFQGKAHFFQTPEEVWGRLEERLQLARKIAKSRVGPQLIPGSGPHSVPQHEPSHRKPRLVRQRRPSRCQKSRFTQTLTPPLDSEGDTIIVAKKSKEAQRQAPTADDLTRCGDKVDPDSRHPLTSAIAHLKEGERALDMPSPVDDIEPTGVLPSPAI